jgi:hypothetical protein
MHELLTGAPDSPRLKFLREKHGAALSEVLKGKCFISEDVLAAASRKVPARGWMVVPLTLPDLGAIAPVIEEDPDVIELFLFTGVSRRAQLGMDPKGFGRNKKTGGPEALVFNHSLRDLSLDKKAPIGYFIYPDSEPLEGDAIEDVITNRMIIQGEEGVAWSRWYSPQTRLLSGVELFLDPDSRTTIKPKKDKTKKGKNPVRIHHGPSVLHGRGEVDKHHSRWYPSEESEPEFVVSQTLAKIYLPENLHGICSRDVIINGMYDPTSEQLNSVWLRGGNTGKEDAPNEIRAEHSVGSSERPPTSLIVHFYNG